MFRIGDKVELRDDLIPKKYYGLLPYFLDLEYWQYKEMTIEKSYMKNGYRHYIMEENYYIWSEEMLLILKVKYDKNNKKMLRRKRKVNEYATYR